MKWVKVICIGLVLGIVLVGLMTGCQDEGNKIDKASEDIVYKAETGEKYHRGSCSHLKHSREAISRKEAKARGLKPCKRCKP